MTMQTNLFKPLTMLAICALMFSGAIAQKLPNVQQKSLRAPANVKVDGKATEWDDSFQAYNHATDVYYSLANDDNKLYLVVQAKDNAIINKIIGGGIELTIQKSGKKNDKDGVTVLYPVFDAKDRPYVRGGGGPGGPVKMTSFGGGGAGVATRTIDVAGVSGAPVASATTVIRTEGSDGKPGSNVTEGDSIMNVYNQRLDNGSKNIIVHGIAGLDTLISVYNEDGIKVGERFNTKMVYTVEIGIDLKKLGLSANEASKFAYHIKLNGAPMGITRMVINGQEVSPSDPKIQEMMSQLRVNRPGGEPTDFWGEYTLAKN